jgi:hypothetical protein
MQNEPTKEELLQDIEKLISYGRDENTINPSLLKYLSVEELISIKNSLQKRVNTLDEDDKEWLMKFIKE